MSQAVKVEQLDELEEEWQAILPSCSTNTIFVTPWWQKTWWRHFGDGSELRLLSLRSDGGLLGIAPLFRKDGVISLLGDSDLCDYNDFLIPKGNDAEFYASLMDHLSTTEWHTMNLVSLPEDSPTLRLLPALAEQNGYAVELKKEDVAPVATLPSSWDEYVAGLSKKGRHELRRKLRRLETAGISRQYVCRDPETVQERMQDFFRLHRESRADKAVFMTLERERFFTDVALELAARDQLKLAFLELDGAPVATCISFDYLDSCLLYNSGYDPRYSKLSVGLLNKALAIKDAIDSGKSSFDFLKGTERYKYDLGGEDHAVYQLVIRR